MKKVFLMFAVVGIIGLSSCSKDYTCSCDNGFSVDFENVDEKSDAENACTTVQATQSLAGTAVSCDLD